jgi:UPF0755 protein
VSERQKPDGTEPTPADQPAAQPPSADPTIQPTKNKKSRWRKVVGGIFVLLLFAVITLPALIAAYVLAPGPLVEEKTVVIERGSAVAAIANQLAEGGVIREPLLLRLLARFVMPEGLRAGEYAFPAAITFAQTLNMLREGRVVIRRITIPEGLTVYEIIEQLRTEPTLSGEITALPPEGSLLPETYHYTLNDDRNAIIKRMQGLMQSTLQELWAQRTGDSVLKTPEQAVIMASIIEKETGVKEERTRVAGVFENRLRQGMKLQSDPTVIYALTGGKGPLPRPLLRKDWEFQSPYNTYVIVGLPPQPIANPGRASLQAALQPERHEYLYFVADGTGGHVFAKTLADHNANVAQWLKIRPPPD